MRYEDYMEENREFVAHNIASVVGRATRGDSNVCRTHVG